MSLSLSHIAHRFGATPVLVDASLEVPTGEIVCLLGPSGCGKTTLLRLVAGLEPLQTGDIRLHGRPIGDRPQAEVAIVFQDFLLFPHLTALQNVAFGLTGQHRQRKSRAEAELAAVGLADEAGRYPHELSGGQQQRVALARAFARDPQAVLLDEPFASIDAALRRRLRQSLRAVLKARGATALIVTHDAEEALDLGDLIAIMGDGRILEAATPRALYESPATLAGASVFPGAQVADGATLRAFGLESSCAPGDTVALLAGALAATPDAGASGRVIDCRFVGPGYQASIAATDAPDAPTLRAATDAPLTPGARVRLRLDPARLRRFPAADELPATA